jgi:hypothetical protein
VFAVAGGPRMGEIVRAIRLAWILLARVSRTPFDVLTVRLRRTARILRIRAVWIVVCPENEQIELAFAF